MGLRLTEVEAYRGEADPGSHATAETLLRSLGQVEDLRSEDSSEERGELPLLVDIDTGFGPSAFNIERTVKALIKAGAAACHIEDQVGAKRCGHRPGSAA